MGDPQGVADTMRILGTALISTVFSAVAGAGKIRRTAIKVSSTLLEVAVTGSAGPRLSSIDGLLAGSSGVVDTTSSCLKGSRRGQVWRTFPHAIRTRGQQTVATTNEMSHAMVRLPCQATKAWTASLDCRSGRSRWHSTSRPVNASTAPTQ